MKTTKHGSRRTVFGMFRVFIVGLACLAGTLSSVAGETKNVKLDANGGKVTPATIAVVEDGTYGELPVPTKTGGEFEGWWTAKDGGVQVLEGDAVDLSIFANPKTPTLYAQWRKACKITVSGGLLTDEPTVTTAKTGLYRGDYVGVGIDGNKLYDKNYNKVNAFANWTYTPATADLGEGFDPFNPEVMVTMPNADVKLTANFVNGFAAYIYADYYMQGEAGNGDFYWSVDNGKTLIPFGYEYPVKAGKVTVKFYDKKGNWCAADVTLTVDKRGTYKDGNVTRYNEPYEFYTVAKFVPVNNSTTVKLDANGGSGSSEAFFVNGYEYGSLDIPYRKGYVFAGWWTAKEGGEHVTSEKIFNPADFAGQKTPTIYAHWLQFKKLTMKDGTQYAGWYLDEETFDDQALYEEVMESLCIMDPECEGGGYIEGKGVLEVLPGARVDIEAADNSYDKKGNELCFQRWTVTPSKVNMGADFLATQSSVGFIMPNEDVTLQPTYIDESTSGTLGCVLYYEPIYLGYNGETGEGVYLKPPVGSLEWSVDGGKNWYKATMIDVSYADDDSEFYGDYPLLKAGKYTVTYRSTDSQWSVPAAKTTVEVSADGWHVPGAPGMSFTPQVVVDIMAYDRDEGGYIAAPGAGSVTLNPKDGLVPAGKTVTFTAKAAKDYVFVGYQFGKNWSSDYLYFYTTAGTWKLENYANHYYAGLLTMYIDPSDMKVHVIAAFKSLSDYDADDILFTGFYSYMSESFNEATYDDKGNASVTIKAVAGCDIGSAGLECDPNAFPLTYKLNGKLPDGLKFDAKTGIISGAPKRAGSATVSIAAIDPAKNSKSITVKFEVSALPTWLVGEYRGITNKKSWVDGELAYLQQNGVIELTVKSDGKVSAKLLTRTGTRSVSGALLWYPYDDEEGEGEDEASFSFFATWTKDDEECEIYFHSDGTITGYADSYNKTKGCYDGGDIAGLRQNAPLLAESTFLDKYYTFAFSAETTTSGAYYWDDDLGEEVCDESTMTSGYGYLTVKTDKNGGAKVTGQLPDGEKVSMSALVMPFALETTEGIGARLYLFASPSAYKKSGWFAMTMLLNPDGFVMFEEGAAWMTSAGEASGGSVCSPSYEMKTQVSVFGEGALYSEAKPLENYYWMVSCAWSGEVRQEYSYKYLEENEANPSKPYSRTEYANECAQEFDGYFFNVAVKGDSKGAISLKDKSPAPWEQKETYKGEDGKTYTDKWWNYWADKNGKEITDPSQLSISFTKATGIFTGKASVYFDYWLPSYKQNSKTKEIECSETMKHVTASLPYAGVMIADGEGGYTGYGAAVHTYKYTYFDDDDRAKTDTKKISLPVSLDAMSIDEP